MGDSPHLGGRKFLLFDEHFPYQGVGYEGMAFNLPRVRDR